MLRFIYGPAGSGKTSSVYEQLRKLAHSDVEKIMLIVPEQFSFETERKLLSYLGEKPFSHVEVYSFTRLCGRIFELYGGKGQNYADKTVKILLMDMALKELSDTFVHFKRASLSRSFISTALSTVEELKRNGVSAKEYAEALEGAEDSPEVLKLREISLIYSAYQSLLDRSYQDPMDDYERALKLIREYRCFDGYTIFLDEFKDFTKPEFEMIEQMVRQAYSCTFTLCTNRSSENQLLFRSVKKTADRLKRIAFENGVPVEKPAELSYNYRFENGALAYLENNVFRSRLLPYEEANSAVRAVIAGNEYEEVDYALSWIEDLVQTKGFRYRDIAVMCRSLESYRRVLEPAFRKYGIPFFTSGKMDVETFPAIRFVNACLRAAVSRFDTGDVLNLLKCEMLPFSLEEISVLENYVYTWNINGRRWEAPFEENPRGFKGELNDEDLRLLETANRVRKAVIEPLASFRSSASGMTVREICGELYRLFERIGFKSSLEKKIGDLRQKGEHDLSETSLRTWELILKILEDMVAAAGDVGMDLDRFSELFSLAVRGAEMADRPQTLDCVIVGSPEQMRVDSPKAVAILGVNDGLFPYVPKDMTLLQNEERRLLDSIGIELPGDFKERVLEERFVAYKALTSPSSDLLLTARRSDIAGTVQQISPLFKQIESMFPGTAVFDLGDVSPEYYCRTRETSYLTLAKYYTSGSDTVRTIRKSLEEAGYDRESMKLLDTALNPEPFAIRDAELAKRLFGGNVRLSPSRIESYFKCPFLYFCRYGLKAMPRPKAELNPVERGLVIHDILYRIVSEHGEELLSYTEEEIRTVVKEYLDDYLENVMGGEEGKPKRLIAVYYRLQDTVSNIVMRLVREFSQSSFRPVDYELEIGSSDDVSPLTLETADGSQILVSGTIDRVDLCEIGGERYVRVVDYKSGNKVFRFGDVFYGLNLQMILYLFMLWKNGKEKYQDVFPAGVLYMPAGDGKPDLPRHASEEAIEKKRLSQYKMNGFVLDQPDVIAAMERDVAGVYIPVSKNKDGSLSKKSVFLELEELGRLERYVNRLIYRMAEMLHSGEIDAHPTFSGQTTSPCTYCDYSAVCGRKREMSRIKPVREMSKEEFLTEIGGEIDG